jgi:shikimate dehydrogenase
LTDSRSGAKSTSSSSAVISETPGPNWLSTISGAARTAGVIGWPITHSLSPRLHGLWLRQYGIDGAYVPMPVRPEHLAEALSSLPKLGFHGANVTLPHKERALALVHRATPAARRIGAVNTIVVAVDGSLIGSNTDGFGFTESMRGSCPTWRADAGRVVVLGAGGAARAIVATLCDEGAPEIILINRSPSRAAALRSDLKGAIRIMPWSEREQALAGAAFLVNTTTLGMRYQPPLDLDLGHLPPDAVVCDIVYSPLETPLLMAARARGNPVVGGLGMLLHQARPGFAAWFGTMPEVTPEFVRMVLAERGDGC